MWPTGEKTPSSLPALVSCWWLFYRFAFENWKGRKTLKRVNDEVNTVGQSMAERKVKQPRMLVARNAIMKVVFPKWTSLLSPIFLSELQYFSPILIPLRCVSPYRTHLFEQLCRPEKGLDPELLRCFLLDFFLLVSLKKHNRYLRSGQSQLFLLPAFVDHLAVHGYEKRDFNEIALQFKARFYIWMVQLFARNFPFCVVE